jgi:bifunctional non-homologous end joining protein LigD
MASQGRLLTRDDVPWGVRRPMRIASWVDPKFFADVEYRDITSEGLLRTSSFKGFSRQ